MESGADKKVMRIAVFILTLAAAAQAALGGEAGAELFESPKLRTFKITIAPDQYQALKNDNRKYVRATVNEGGITYSNVAVRLKGMGSFRPLHEKPSLAV